MIWFSKAPQVRAETAFKRKIDEITIHNTESESTDYEALIKSISISHERRFGKNTSCMWVDIWCHYLIFKDWTVVQTRCIDEIGYHNSKNNKTSLWVALVWNFNNEKPSQEQYDALNILLWVLKSNFTWAVVKPHRAWGASCPWKYFDQNQISWYLNNNIPLPTIKDGSIWTFVLSRYYSPQDWQTDYFQWNIRNEVKMNCWISPKVLKLSDNCIYPSNWEQLKPEMAWLVGACPEWLFNKTLIIDMWFGKQEFRCIDKWWAIVWNRLDIRAWFWQVWYDNIKNWTVHNTGKAKVRIK